MFTCVRNSQVLKVLGVYYTHTRKKLLDQKHPLWPGRYSVLAACSALSLSSSPTRPSGKSLERHLATVLSPCHTEFSGQPWPLLWLPKLNTSASSHSAGQQGFTVTELNCYTAIQEKFHSSLYQRFFKHCLWLGIYVPYHHKNPSLFCSFYLDCNTTLRAKVSEEQTGLHIIKEGFLPFFCEGNIWFN